MRNAEIGKNPSSQSDGERGIKQGDERNKDDSERLLDLHDVRSRVEGFIDEQFPLGCLGAPIGVGPAKLDKVAILKIDLMHAVDDFFRKHMRDHFDE